jgi:dihydrofolate synthase/folylpolyglutamate synthase
VAGDLPWDDLARRWPENRIEPSLARIRGLMHLMGDPQRVFPVLHVAGTNGKTSTARMIDALLTAAGLRTGRYTSPHLVDPAERISLAGEPIDDERLAAAWAEVAPYVAVVDATSRAAGEPDLSFFEVVTALAFAAFADAPVDAAVVEVGLGGTWDATNVVDPAVAVVCPVGMDHMDYLGDTLEQIAAEKAGIIKPGCAAVVARQQPGADAVILERAREVAASVAVEGVDFDVVARAVAVGGQVIALRAGGRFVDDILLPLHGEHQANNAATALAAVEAFLPGLDADVIRAGFAAATSPGRLEVVRRSPTVILDAAHNPHGAAALALALEESFAFATLVGVVGVLSDKDATGMLEALEPVLAHIVCTQPRSPRALAALDLAATAAGVFGEDRVTVADDLGDAIDRAAALAEADLQYGGSGVLVTGSIVLVGEARALLAGTERPAGRA